MNLGTKEIRRKLHKAKANVWYRGEEKDDFNKFHWDKFVRFYGMKSDERYSHNRALKGENPSYVYSQQAIELMVQEIMRDPEHVIDSMVASLSKKK